MIYCWFVLHYTLTYLYFTGLMFIYRKIEYAFYLKFKLTQYYNKDQKRQHGAKVICGDYGTMRYFVVRKDYEYRRSIVVEVLQKCNSRLKKGPWLKTTFCRSFSNIINRGFQLLTKASSYLPNEVDPFFTPKGESESITISILNKAKLIHYIADLARLISAFKSIISTNSNLTKSVSNPIIDSLKEISQLLVAGKFKFNKCVIVPEAARNKIERSLAKVLFSDKIVHKSISEALYDIYEPIFLNYSHRFRRNKNSHTALKLVDETFKGAKWIITGCIKSCVNNINHIKLLDVLKKQVRCVKTLALIKKSLKTNYMINQKNITNIKAGLSQDSILSPILSLIYLHEFDLFMDSLITEYRKGKDAPKNLIYEQYQAQIIKALKNNNINEVIRLKKLMRYRSIRDLGYIKIGYVRYADSFLISIRGSNSLANTVLNYITLFLKNILYLDLNINETSISSFQKPIWFLGVMICSGYHYLKSTKSLIKGKNKGIKMRLIPYVRFHAPIRILNEKLIIKKFFKWKSQLKALVRPTARKNLVNLDFDIIVTYYNCVINGLMNYFYFVENWKSVRLIIRKLKLSCALTLALKYKLRTKAKTLRKFKANLEILNHRT